MRHENKHATKHTNKKCTAKNYEYSENYELSLEATNMQGRATKQRMSVQKRWPDLQYIRYIYYTYYYTLLIDIPREVNSCIGLSQILFSSDLIQLIDERSLRFYWTVWWALLHW